MLAPVSDAQWMLWAKADRTDPSLYHPALCHLLDTAAVARTLWDECLSHGVRNRVTDLLGLPDAASAGRAISFLCGLHDIGKISPAFQSKIPVLANHLATCGFAFCARATAPHGLVGTKVLGDLFCEKYHLNGRISASLADVLGGHHGTMADGMRLSRLDPREYRGSGWNQAQAEAIDVLARVTGVADAPECVSDITLDTPAGAAFVGGMTSVADWIASAAEHFPYAAPPVDIPRYAEKAAGLALSALEAIGWTGRMSSPERVTFEELFPGRSPRPMQQEVARIAAETDGPALLLIEAPTGEGKTEAALYFAHAQIAGGTARGFYMAMPTMATANAMFSRVHDFLAGAATGGQVDLQLMHGHADLSPEFQQLRSMSAIAADGDDVDSHGAVIAHEWFAPKKRGLLSSFGVGTIDQSLLSVLDVRHVFVRLFGLAGKTVIFDEVHAYDVYTSALLERLLGWLSALGSSAVLLSATLAEAQRAALLKAYSGNTVEAAPYPSIMYSDVRRSQSVSFSVAPRTPVTIVWVAAPEPEDNDGRLCALLNEELAGGGCAAVICNTVRRAQELWRHLRDATDLDVGLFHARYPFEERFRREQEAIRKYSRGAADRPARSVLVATQVIEQSLDVDFDLMVSEMAPVDLLLQRAGRLHRHSETTRPARLSAPRLFLLQPPCNEDEIPDFGSGKSVYAEYVLLRSWLALRERDQIEIPADVAPLIADVYDENDDADQFAEPLAKAWEEVVARREKLAREASGRMVLAPSPDIDISELTQETLEEDNPQIHAYFRALTRWSDTPSVTLICLYGTAQDAYIDAAHSKPVRLDVRPDDECVRALLNRAVTINMYDIEKHFPAHSIPPAWRTCALLRYTYPICFDEAGAYHTDDFTLHLSEETGLTTEYQRRS